MHAHRTNRLAESTDATRNKDVNIYEILAQDDASVEEPMVDDEETILEVTVLPENGSTA